jgi:hypothetical protein
MRREAVATAGPLWPSDHYGVVADVELFGD